MRRWTEMDLWEKLGKSTVEMMVLHWFYMFCMVYQCLLTAMCPLFLTRRGRFVLNSPVDHGAAVICWSHGHLGPKRLALWNSATVAAGSSWAIPGTMAYCGCFMRIPENGDPGFINPWLINWGVSPKSLGFLVKMVAPPINQPRVY